MAPSPRRATPGSGREPATPAAASVAPRDRTFLVSRQDALLPAGVSAIDADSLLAQLEADPAVTVERVMAPEALALLAEAPTSLQRIVVARMPDEKAREIAQHPQVLVEEDAPLRPMPSPGPTVEFQDPSVFIPFGGTTTWRLRVVGPDGTPAAGAAVYLYGGGVPAQGRTDGDGQVELSLVNETDDTVRALYINPQSTFWNLWVDRPRITSGEVNVVRLTPLASTLQGFPGAEIIGWGQRAMRMDRLDPRMNGSGVKVAVIDLGAATTHRDLGQIKTGMDLTVQPASDTTWTDDVVAHGSHCSGVIAGLSDAAGIRGFAPGAEVHELRIFPGGRFSTLLDALQTTASSNRSTSST